MSSLLPPTENPTVSLQELPESLDTSMSISEELLGAYKLIERSNQEWVAALDVISDLIFLHDKQFRILRCNKAYQQCAGLAFHEIVGQPYYTVFPRADGPLPCCLHAMEQAAVAEEEEEEEELTVGETIWRSRAFSVKDEQGDYLYSVHTLEDITEQKRLSAAVIESEGKFRKISESAQDAIIMMGADRCISFWNPAAERMFGYAAAEALGQDLHQLIVPGELQTRFEQAYPHFQATGEGPIIGQVIQVPALRKGKVEFPVELSISSTLLSGQWHAIAIVRDITERKHHEFELQQVNRALNTIRASNQSLLHATDEKLLLQRMCDVAVEVGGYRLALVCYAQNDAEKSVLPMASRGFEPGEVDKLKISWADVEREQELTGRAIWTGQTQVAHHLGTDSAYAPWRTCAMRHGVASSIALPLRNGAETFGSLTIYAVEEEPFTPETISLLEEMAGDLAFGIQAVRIKIAQHEHERRLEANMLQTVEAIAGIVEMRDPYTSGHQARVAELARAIAYRMGLEEERVKAIHLAGLVHDLGKIRIPAEILSKPGRLNEIEFGLIKMHPQAGYEILKSIDFAWPIAQMVLQHHERLDGSGYPQGLKGEEILLGARILSVADVVEAISSHRPYRPGLGVDAALDEISRLRGVHYDPHVVDVCVALFKERGYVFPG